MAMTKWAPFSAFAELEQEMHALLDRFGGRPWLEGFGWHPDIDVFRYNGELIVVADLPGIDPVQDLAIYMANNVLRIEGEKCETGDIDALSRLVHERRCGRFERCVLLPDGVETDAVVAQFDNGTLTVRVPLPEGAIGGEDPHPVKIDVTTTSGTDPDGSTR